METSHRAGSTCLFQDEQDVLRARQAGELSVEESFRALFDLHGRAVLAWLLVRVPRDQADDLFQEVWCTFYVRWRVWEFREHLASPDARPVLSFLFRTAAFVRQGKYRRKRVHESFESTDEETAAEIPDTASGAAVMDQQVELGRCLDLAAEVCSPEELDALLAKLSGLSGEEMARALGISPAIADHRYRSAVARLRRELGQAPGSRRRLQPKDVQP
jgi:DNA-directed RNA polymerase specialized sigma24 family protein